MDAILWKEAEATASVEDRPMWLKQARFYQRNPNDPKTLSLVSVDTEVRALTDVPDVSSKEVFLVLPARATGKSTVSVSSLLKSRVARC